MNVSVIIPALNEEHTVAEVVRACLVDDPLEVLVIDADSTDATASRAAAAGADVRNWCDILSEEPRPGKGESLWRGVAAAKGDIVVFVDADLESAAPGMIAALAAPFVDPAVDMVKARYQRSLNGQPTGGGRVTELTAKPLIKQFFPELAHIDQPLGGRRQARHSGTGGLGNAGSSQSAAARARADGRGGCPHATRPRGSHCSRCPTPAAER